LCCLLLTHGFMCAASVVVYVDQQGGLFGFTRPDVNDPISALTALATPPSAAEAGQELGSGVLPGTKVLALQTEGDTTTVEFSLEIIGSGLDESRLIVIFQQVKATLRQFGLTGSIRLQAGGKLLSDYLPPINRGEQKLPPTVITPNVTGSLAGKSIALSPGHGYFWNGSGWHTQRPVYCSPLNQEDFHNLEEMQYLNTYLTQDGATTKPYRCLDKSFGNHPSGYPWWQMGGYLWVQHLGFPCSIYASSTGDCTTGSGGTEDSDDVRARPLAADSDNTDIYVALHSNGYAGDCTSSCPTGSETYYDASSEHATWGAISQVLATDINNALMAAITANADATWTCHGTCVKDANGSYGEIRIPNRAATLTELAFHDSCNRDADANHLRDNFFRSTCMWGMYKGICDYFGVAPTWAFYSDELVSHDLPASMTPGQTATVHITYRNRGVLWNDARSFRLGAVGDSDPFTATTRYNVGGEVGPNTTKTFTLTLTAPMTPGTYTTDWRMLREGVNWFGQTLTVIINVSGTPGGPSITTQPQSQTVNPGGTVNFTVAATGNAPLSYRWHRNAVELSNGGNISGATATTLTISNVQQTNAGTYSVVVSNTNGSANSADAVLTVGIPGIAIGSYTIDSGNMDSTSRNPNYVAYTTCGLPAWYSYGVPGPAGSNCTVFDRDIRWMPALPTYGFTGRGSLTASAIVPDNHATATLNFYAVDASGADLAGPITGSVNECAYSCAWVTFYNASVNLSSFAGWRSNTQNDGPPGAGGCSTTCGSFPAGYGQVHIQAARWHYLDDWTCLGGYASTNVSDTTGRAFAWGEAGLYLYPAVDTSHGNHITADLGLNGKTPGRVTTGDCNNANTLDYKTNASGYGGGDNMDAYGFAWVLAPNGAGPRFVIGSDDGNRVWVNGSLINDTNASRSLTRDQDNPGVVSLTTGWNRVLFKIHNITGGFQGTVSLRNGADVSLNEPSVNVFDLGGYYSYGLGCEQDAWYPFIYVTNFCGGDNPQPGGNYYDNDTTVTASGTAVASGPVPFWRVMHYEWGFGLSGDTEYATVNSSGTSWSHTQAGVTGHRRFYFFAVSKSGRTSFQNNGQTGGSNWTGGGSGNYVDVYVDNLPPLVTGFSNLTAVSSSEIDLAWGIPLDQGVGIGPGADEAADETSNSSGNYYRVGDVGVEVYRDGSIVSSWGAGTTASNTGLDANSHYTYTLAARDNNNEARGAWHNVNGEHGSATIWTLSVSPGPGSITADQAMPPVGSNVTWTAANGFGPGKVEYYRYAWDTSPTHTWTDTETQWPSGTITTVPDSAGAWYLHVKGYNRAAVGNGTFDYSVRTAVVFSQTNAVSSMVDNGDDTFTLRFVGTPQARYYVVTSLYPWTPMSGWAILPNSTNIAPPPSGVWSVTVTNDDSQRFYRSAAVNPAP
jgi:N-acetylmuramoyl-L-alanine amidase